MTSEANHPVFRPRVVLPGETLPEVTKETTDDDKKFLLGPGLRREGSKTVIVSKPGVLRRKLAGEKNEHVILWVDCHSKRYVAARGENVIGVVVNKSGDSFRVELGCSDTASLSYLAFEGATKKNRPNVNVGDVVYAKLLVASNHTEPELVCVDSYGKKAGLGVLAEGFVFSVPLHLVRKMLSKECVLLQVLGENLPFEVAVGMNGRMWIRGKTPRDTICLANAVMAAEFMSNQEIRQMVGKLVDALAGF